MKYYFYFLYSIIFLLFSCDTAIKKPEKLLSPEQMEKILYDIAILNATKNIDNHNIDSYYVDSKNIIYKQNGIDSLQLVENITFYASKPKQYQTILKKVELRLKEEDSILFFNKNKKDSIKIPNDEQKEVDSLDKISNDSLQVLNLNP